MADAHFIIGKVNTLSAMETTRDKPDPIKLETLALIKALADHVDEIAQRVADIASAHIDDEIKKMGGPKK